jgi:hypothetical protein
MGNLKHGLPDYLGSTQRMFDFVLFLFDDFQPRPMARESLLSEIFSTIHMA